MTKRIKGYLRAKKDKIAVAFNLLAIMLLTSNVSAFASDPETSGIELNFEPATMFKWTQMILDVMMPVLYITLGISLAFIIIRALKAAFA